jgi:superfamily II RNA helicase
MSDFLATTSPIESSAATGLSVHRQSAPFSTEPLLDQDGKELVFDVPLQLADDEQTLDKVVARITKAQDGKLNTVKIDYKQEQQKLLRGLEGLLNYEEDEAELLRIEKLKHEEMDRKLVESMSAIKISKKTQRRSGYEDDEEDEVEEDGPIDDSYALAIAAAAAEEEEEEEEEEDDDMNYRKPKTYSPVKNVPTASIASAPVDGPVSVPAPVVVQPKKRKDGNKWVDDTPLPAAGFKDLLPNLALEYPFTLDTFQQQAIMRLERREHVFVAAHTSAGKTGKDECNYSPV